MAMMETSVLGSHLRSTFSQNMTPTYSNQFWWTFCRFRKRAGDPETGLELRSTFVSAATCCELNVRPLRDGERGKQKIKSGMCPCKLRFRHGESSVLQHID